MPHARPSKARADVTHHRSTQVCESFLEVHMKRLEIDVEGGTVLITGAATGIGRATALAFAAARAAVVIGDIDPRAEATASVMSLPAAKPHSGRRTYPTTFRCRRWRARFRSSARLTSRSTTQAYCRRPHRLPSKRRTTGTVSCSSMLLASFSASSTSWRRWPRPSSNSGRTTALRSRILAANRHQKEIIMAEHSSSTAHPLS